MRLLSRSCWIAYIGLACLAGESWAERGADTLLPPPIRIAEHRQAELTPPTNGASSGLIEDQGELISPNQPQQDGMTPRGPFRPITAVGVDVSLPPGLLPTEKEVDPAARLGDPVVVDGRLDRLWAHSELNWTASCTRHRPLHFEQVNLERYGYSYCRPLQPFISGAHFFVTIPALPYKITADPPCDCVYTLGHYRPGNCVPWQRVRWPLNAKAGLVQAGTVVGLVFLIP